MIRRIKKLLNKLLQLRLPYFDWITDAELRTLHISGDSGFYVTTLRRRLQMRDGSHIVVADTPFKIIGIENMSDRHYDDEAFLVHIEKAWWF